MTRKRKYSKEINDGKPFEKIVAFIQETYKDSPNTKIYTNYKIRNKIGKLREFDVFIITKVNGYDFTIAIECKDYKKPVSVEKIDAFNSKCSTINNINKKVFVSSKGYQSGAIENAMSMYDIELCTLKNITKSGIMLNPNIEESFSRVAIRFVDYIIRTKDSQFGSVLFTRKEVDRISTMDNGIEDECFPPSVFLEKEFYKSKIKNIMLSQALERSMKGRSSTLNINTVIKHSYEIHPANGNKLYLRLPSKSLMIENIEIFLEFQVETVNQNSIQIKSYTQGEQKKGEVYTVQFSN